MNSQQSFTPWDRKGAIAKELVKQFKLFTDTNGNAGIDPSVTKPAAIREIRNQNQFLHPLNPQYFASHFRDLSRDFGFVTGDNSRANKATSKKGETIQIF